MTRPALTTIGRLLMSAGLALVLGAAAMTSVASPTPSAAHVDAPAMVQVAYYTTPITYVENHLPGSTYAALVNDSQNFVDLFTGKDWRMGTCRSGYHCIRLYESTYTNGHWGWTYHPTGSVSYARINIHPWVRTSGKVSYYTKRALLDHELGHTVGLPHNPYFTSRMWQDADMRKDGKLAPRTFTTKERERLRAF